jgi:trigger factor
MYGADLFVEDAIYESASEYYGQFLDNNKEVIPVARPQLVEKSIKITDKNVSYSISVVVKPDVVLGQYKGLSIAASAPEEVADSEIDAELSRLAERNARFVEVSDRPVKDGDEVNLDYSGSVDGVKFEGGTAENQSLKIGSHSFIAGFEEQLVGMNIGEIKDIDVTFPEEYQAKELAGKPAVFTCKINGITAKELPAIDDEFAKDVSEFDSLDEFKADIKSKLAEDKEKAAENKDENILIDTVVGSATVDVPAEMIDEQVEEYIEDFKYQLSYQGLNIDDYFKYTGTTLDQLKEQHKERAAKTVRSRLVFEAIVKAENVTATDEEVDAKARDYAEKMGQEADKFIASLTPDQRGYFVGQAVTEKLIEFLKTNNTIA